jgi:hypothetical protein
MSPERVLSALGSKENRKRVFNDIKKLANKAIDLGLGISIMNIGDLKC